MKQCKVRRDEQVGLGRVFTANSAPDAVQQGRMQGLLDDVAVKHDVMFHDGLDIAGLKGDDFGRLWRPFPPSRPGRASYA